MLSKIAQLESNVTFLKKQHFEKLKLELDIKTKIDVQQQQLLLMDNMVATLAKQIAFEHLKTLGFYIECIRYLYVEPEREQIKQTQKKHKKQTIFKKVKQLLTKFRFCTK